jgi:hypothetical protein
VPAHVSSPAATIEGNTGPTNPTNPTSSASSASCASPTGPARLAAGQVASLADAFATVPDPRCRRGRWHPLMTILLIAACAVTCDANGLTAVWQWVADADEATLARLQVRLDPLTRRRRPPSERTIRRVLAGVDPQAVQAAAGGFVADRLHTAGMAKATPPVTEREQRRAVGGEPYGPPVPTREAVHFDGKTLRGARRPDGSQRVLLAGAEHSTDRVIAQQAIAAKTNEIPELRTLVAGMDLSGLVVTADAIHCQQATAQAIVAAGGDYLLVLKANQARLLAQVVPRFFDLTGIPQGGGIDDHVLHDRSEADRVPDLRLLLLRKVDALRVAAALEVENARVRPAVLVVSYETPLGICR